MNHSNITTAVLLLLSAATVQARDTDNNGFIDSLMAEMSIEEKIGQLNLPAAGMWCMVMRQSFQSLWHCRVHGTAPP